MKALKARIPKALNHRTIIPTCDNSGARLLRLISIKGAKTVRRKRPAAGIGDLVLGSVIAGTQEMRKQIVYAVVVRQKKEYRRLTGERIKFEDNAVVILKDDKGNPKGTIFKGPIAKEAVDRWPGIAKIASIVV